MMNRRSLVRAATGAAAALVGGVSMAPAVRADAAGDGYAFVDVPTYAQQRNLSCEYACCVIAMGAFGVWVSEWAFDDLVPLSENPHWGYRGDITGWWGNVEDYGIYAEPLVAPLAQFGFRGNVFYGQGDASQLQTWLQSGVPVLVWIGLWGDDGVYQTANDGSTYKLVPGAHVVVAYGYDGDGVYAADPATGGTKWMGWGEFMWMWNAFDGMALAVSPA